MASLSSSIDSDSKSSGSSKLSAEDEASAPDSPSSSNGTDSTPPISPSTSPPPASPPPTSSPPSPPPPPPSSSPPPSSPPPSPPESSPPPPLSPPHERSPPPPSPPPKSSPPPPPPPPKSPSPPPQLQSPHPPDQSSAPPNASPTPPSSPPPSQNSSTPLTPGSPNNWSATGNSSTPPSTTVSPPVAPAPPNTPPRVWGPPPLPQSTSTTSSSGSSSNSRSPSSSRDSSGGGNTENYVGYAVAGVLGFILLAILIVFVIRRKRKRKVDLATHFGAANNLYKKPGTEGLYYTQQSGKSNYANEGFYTSQAPTSPNSRTGNQAGAVQHFGSPDSPWNNGQICFSYEQVTEITRRFSSENIIGEGGFGCVYKGWLSDGKEVAVKQLKAGSGQGDREFRAEVEIISRVHHRHLVSLVGYCIADHRRVLIYEFLPNKTLEYHLHGVKVLDWDKRMKIAIGSAKGLAYLHEDCNPKIIHRDIKSANILLDNAFEAKVADFGLARLHDGANSHVSTRVMGTFGYLAPEYATSGKLTDRSDVFSFGVVLLELITGRKPVDQTRPLGEESLVEWARPLLSRAIETRDFSELVDERLHMQFVERDMCRMIEAAAACVRHSAPKRPRMIQVVRALDSQNESCDLSNGVKYGQSTVYDASHYSDEAIMKFRKMAIDGCSEISEFDRDSGEYSSGELSGQQHSWLKDASSSESESRAFNASRRTL